MKASRMLGMSTPSSSTFFARSNWLAPFANESRMRFSFFGSLVVSWVTGAHLILSVRQELPISFELLRVLCRGVDECVFEVPRAPTGEHLSQKIDLALSGLDDPSARDQQGLQAVSSSFAPAPIAAPMRLVSRSNSSSSSALRVLAWT